MPPASATAEPNLIPDCCNIGVVFRVLAGANAAVLLGLWGRGQGWLAGLQEFIETSMLVEMICLSSLLVLCNLRRWSALQHVSKAGQRLICAIVPALMALVLLGFLARLDWFRDGFPRLDTAYTAMLCFVLGLAFQHYFELKTRAYSPALGEARLQALQARIRPHFLFNSLNAVLSLIRTEPRRAETVLEDLAELFRALMRDTRNMTSLADELRLCEHYLAIEKIRLGDRLLLQWDLHNLKPADIAAIRIPCLLLQPLLENAVHYGVEPCSGTALIRVELARRLDKIEVKIGNPYHGQAQLPGGNQMALENIRQRLTLLYDIEAGISSGVVADQFEVSLYFPAKA